jgi:dimethylhistidine N-methyltransferase
MQASGSLKIETDFARDVRAGLTQPGQKELSSRYFYDGLGTALFEAITLLPEYGLTRADSRILSGHAAEIIQRTTGPLLVSELGSGTGQKTRYLLEALVLRQGMVRYSPIDVSASALDQCRRQLQDLVDVRPFEQPYIPGLRHASVSRSSSERLLVLFLGSTIGNFGPNGAIEFLSDLRAAIQPEDHVLLGADLVKPALQLLAAYDDPTGVTAAFNLNILARINRELGGNFNLRCFEHEARYDEAHQRIEMHLRSRSNQKVTIPGADCAVEIRAGETIWTESSHKYQLGQLEQMAAASGFAVEQVWTDQEWPFAECLWTAN